MDYINHISRGYKYSINGLKCACGEKAFRIEIVLLMLTLPIIFLSNTSKIEKIILFSSIVLIMIIELINSSIERTIDRISLSKHNLSGQAKDMASCAVFFACINAAIIWATIFLF